jgi:MOB kinase activator 1
MSLWEKMVGEGKKGTLKPTKKHGTLKQATLSKLKHQHTLGVPNLIDSVKLPEGESKNDWLAANIVDFFNEISLLLGLVMEPLEKKYTQPGEGFPPGFEYRWLPPGKKPIRVSSPEYIDYVMTWVDSQLDNESIFPVNEGDPWPEDFQEYAADIFKRLFRVFAILFHRAFDEFEKLEAQAHLNTVFKHFCFFAFEFKLLDSKETDALKAPVAALMADWKKT